MSASVEIELRTRHLPPVRWDSAAEAASAANGDGSPRAGFDLGGVVLRWLRPALTVRTPLCTWTRAPAGEPGASTWPLLPFVAVSVLLVVLALAVVGCWAIVRAVGRRA